MEKQGKAPRPMAAIKADYGALLNDHQVAEMTSIPVGTLRWYRHCNPDPGPKWFRLGGRTIRYAERDVREWIAQQYANAGRSA